MVPSEVSAIHWAELVPKPCSDLSQAVRSLAVAGPCSSTSRSHSSSERPVFRGSSLIQLRTYWTLGWTLYGWGAGGMARGSPEGDFSIWGVLVPLHGSCAT